VDTEDRRPFRIHGISVSSVSSVVESSIEEAETSVELQIDAIMARNG